jgi:membrane complex biogenesis BtpA family protein
MDKHPVSLSSVAPPRRHALDALFGRQRGVLIGVVHLRPLPGSPSYDGEPVGRIYEQALADAAAYTAAGFDGMIVENHGDVPFLKPDALGPETAAVMAIAAERVRAETGRPVGINVLANAALHALAIARAAGSEFVRVNQWANAYVANEGLIEGPAAQALRYRRSLAADEVRIFADSHVKHGSHAITADRSVAELTRDLEWSLADVVIATGQRTGDAASADEIDAIRSATTLPLLVGSGVTAANLSAVLGHADGVIVASALKVDGLWWNAVDPERARSFAKMAAAAR